MKTSHSTVKQTVDFPNHNMIYCSYADVVTLLFQQYNSHLFSK